VASARAGDGHRGRLLGRTLQAVLFREELPIGFVFATLVGAYSVGAHAPFRASLGAVV